MKGTFKFFAVFLFIIVFGFLLVTSKTTPVLDEAVYNLPLETAPPLTEVPIVEKPIPTELSIESVGIKAPIELVGVVNGAMGVPTLAENVGWYDLGAHPGDIGSAVFAGHVNWRDSPTAVFMNLKKVKIGDIVTVTNSDGSIVYFIVSKIENYPLYADTKEVFSSDDGLAHLNLITCNGLWDALIKSHASRLVVFTEKISLLP